MLAQEVRRDAIQPRQRRRVATVVPNPGFEGDEEDVTEEIPSIFGADPPSEEPEDRLSVPIEDFPEPIDVAKRFLDQGGVGRWRHTPYLPPMRIAVRGLTRTPALMLERPPPTGAPPTDVPA